MAISPYIRLMRLHRPVGIWLLLWPCWWSVTLASSGFPDVTMLLLFAAGAVLMRSAGCVINDIIDRDIDRQVERTRTRPLASGELSVRQALGLLSALLALSLGIATALGPDVMMWAVFSLPLVAAYPFMKRITWWPQLFLGLTFNWGALMGWAAVRGDIEWPALLLYVGGIFWTLGYDTIYAHQDKTDDAKIGVRGTALKLGARTRPCVLGFYMIALLCWSFAGNPSVANQWLHSLLVLLIWLQLLWQLRAVNLDNPASCLLIFKSNAWLGGLVFSLCLMAK